MLSQAPTARWGGLLILFGFLFFFACQPSRDKITEIKAGLSRHEVREVLGEPDQIKPFILPETPFFGPGEHLANILPPGSEVEEWLYPIEGEILYVWFSGPLGSAKESWTVLETAVYPEGAVY